VGTNSRDYAVAHGLSSLAVGQMSDGLVRIENAYVAASPRAFVNRSHSGFFGIVNSEEGYQNLARFLFGDLCATARLDIAAITLPPEVQQALSGGFEVGASYQFEVAVSVRGCQWQMTRREAREHSAIFRKYDELFPKQADTRAPDRRQSPHLFSVFLDPNKSVKGSKTVSFAFDLKVLVPDYEVGGALFLKRHYEGGFIYRQQILVEALPDPTSPAGWKVKYGYQDINPGKPGVAAPTHPLPNGEPGIGFEIPIQQKTRPGLRGALRIEARPWG
jgi:hypothetical protein